MKKQNQKRKLNIESLQRAIKEFNEENKPAWLCFRQRNGSFFIEVFFNNIDQVTAVTKNGVHVLFLKDEYESSNKLNFSAESYCKEWAEMFYDGWSPEQIDYQLSKKELAAWL